jgi:transmembrane sensor
MTTRKTALLRARERQASWTELREQRALRGLMSMVRSDRAAAPGRRWPMVAAAAALVATALAAGVAWQRSAPAPVPALARIAVPAVSRPLELSDGSSLALAPGADARVVQQTPDAVSVRQLGGRVAYRVSHNPRRAFVVMAGGVAVRVRGTEFTVDFAADRVGVQVQSGRVEVDDGERVTSLVSGEDLRVHAYTDRSAQPSAHRDPLDSPARARQPASAPDPEQDRDRVDELFRTANQPRARGDNARAAADLRQIVQRFPRDPRVASAYFTLARVERSQGHHAAAARAFAACASAAPGGTLAAEALAESAAAWLSAGQSAQAAKVARQYLKRYPSGSHGARMQSIVE